MLSTRLPNFILDSSRYQIKSQVEQEGNHVAVPLVRPNQGIPQTNPFPSRKPFCPWRSPPHRVLLWTFPLCHSRASMENSMEFLPPHWLLTLGFFFPVPVPSLLSSQQAGVDLGSEGIQQRECLGAGIMGWRPRLRATAPLRTGQMEPLEINLFPLWPLSAPALPHKSNPEP